MEKTGLRYLTVVHEFLFSLNLGLVLRLGMQYAGYVETESALKRVLNGLFRLHPHSNIGGNAAFVLLSFEIALGGFLVLRILARLALTRLFLIYAAGIVSIVALPCVWLYGSHLHAPVPGLPDASHVLLGLEISFAAICAVAYLLAKSPPLEKAIFLLLFLHFALWAWLFPVGTAFWHDPFNLIFPLGGFSSSLTWASYVAHSEAWASTGPYRSASSRHSSVATPNLNSRNDP